MCQSVSRSGKVKFSLDTGGVLSFYSPSDKSRQIFGAEGLRAERMLEQHTILWVSSASTCIITCPTFSVMPKNDLFLASIRWEVNVLLFIINLFIPLESQQGTDIWSNSCQSFKRDTPVQLL